MSFIVVAIGAVAVGAGVSAYGTIQNAKSVANANAKAEKNEYGLYLRQNENLDKLVKDKEDKLYNIGNIFDRFESTGAFGDTETLKNLRKAQNDFSQLAAGDFSGFESQLKKSLSDSLVGVMDSGSPVGTYAGLAADTQMQYRGEGIKTAVGISEFLSNESGKLLSQEFGIMDQKFNTAYQLDSNWVNKTNGFNLAKAATVGVGTQAIGGAIQTVGSSLMGASNSGSLSGAFGGATNSAVASAPQALTVVDGAPRAYIPNTTTPYPMSSNYASMAGSFAGSAASSYSNQSSGRSWQQGPANFQGDNLAPLPFDNVQYQSIQKPQNLMQAYESYGLNQPYQSGQPMVLPPRQSSSSLMASVGAKVVY